MSFFWSGYVLHDFLLKGFGSRTVSGFIGICVALFSAGILFEGMFYLKKYFLHRFLDIRKFFQVRAYEENQRRRRAGRGEAYIEDDCCSDGVESAEINPRDSLIGGASSTSESSRRRAARRISRPVYFRNLEFMYLLISSGIHASYAFLGFTLMNAVMTFNVWILLAVCSGIGVGYLAFGTSRLVSDENTSGDTSDFQQARCSIETECESHPFESKTDAGSKSDSPTPSAARSRAPSSKSNESQALQPADGGSTSCQQSLSRIKEDSSPSPTPQVIVVGAQVHNNNFQEST